MKKLIAVLMIVMMSLATPLLATGLDDINAISSSPPLPTTSYHMTEDSSYTMVNGAAFAFMVGGQAADVYTTQKALAGDVCEEGNPLLGSDPSTGLLIAVKAVLIGVAYYATEYHLVPDYGTDARNWVYFPLGVAGLGAAAWNNSLDCY